MFIGTRICKKINNHNRMAAAALPGLPDPNRRRVFCFMGHGCDSFSTADRNRKFRVPQGCTFITLEECGIASKDLPRIMKAFQDPLLIDAWRYPENRQIRDVLSEYYGVSGGSVIRVHEPGSEYTDPFIDLWCPSGEYIFKSGMYELGRVPNEMIGLKMTPEERATHTASIAGGGTGLLPQNLTQERCNYIYNGALFPSAHVARTNRGSIFKRYSQLMAENGNGIYYHFSCRLPCEDQRYNPRLNPYNRILNRDRANLHNIISTTAALKRASSKGAVYDRRRLNNMNQFGLIENEIQISNGWSSYTDTFESWFVNILIDEYRRNDWYQRIYFSLLTRFSHVPNLAGMIMKLLEQGPPAFPNIPRPGPRVEDPAVAAEELRRSGALVEQIRGVIAARDAARVPLRRIELDERYMPMPTRPVTSSAGPAASSLSALAGLYPTDMDVVDEPLSARPAVSVAPALAAPVASLVLRAAPALAAPAVVNPRVGVYPQAALSSYTGQPAKGRTRFVVPDDNDEEELTSSLARSAAPMSSLIPRVVQSLPVVERPSTAEDIRIKKEIDFRHLVTKITKEEAERKKIFQNAEQRRLAERSWTEWTFNKLLMRPGGSRTKRKTYRKKANRRTRKRSMRKRSTHNI